MTLTPEQRADCLLAVAEAYRHAGISIVYATGPMQTDDEQTKHIGEYAAYAAGMAWRREHELACGGSGYEISLADDESHFYAVPINEGGDSSQDECAGAICRHEPGIKPAALPPLSPPCPEAASATREDADTTSASGVELGTSASGHPLNCGICDSPSECAKRGCAMHALAKEDAARIRELLAENARLTQERDQVRIFCADVAHSLDTKSFYDDARERSCLAEDCRAMAGGEMSMHYLELRVLLDRTMKNEAERDRLRECVRAADAMRAQVERNMNGQLNSLDLHAGRYDTARAAIKGQP